MLRAASISGSSDGDDRSEASAHSASNGAPVGGIQASVKLYPSSHRVSMTKYVRPPSALPRRLQPSSSEFDATAG